MTFDPAAGPDWFVVARAVVALYFALFLLGVLFKFKPSVKIEPRDLWWGVFWDRRADGLHVYICPVPVLVLYLAPMHMTRRRYLNETLNPFRRTDSKEGE